MLTGTSVSGWLVEVEPIAPLAVATACLVFSSIVAVRFDLARVVPSPLEPKRDVVNVAPDG
jgi:hypothetical protein